jgi:hypothetical protein
MAAGQANTMPAVASEENGFIYSSAKNDPCTLEIRALFPNQTGLKSQSTSTQPTKSKPRELQPHGQAYPREIDVITRADGR